MQPLPALQYGFCLITDVGLGKGKVVLDAQAAALHGCSISVSSLPTAHHTPQACPFPQVIGTGILESVSIRE
eukprot:599955-Rhodomonas_salina.6